MINIKNVENAFEKYVSNYDQTNERIKLKIDHGKKSCEVLFNNNFIREFIQDDKYDEIIKKSIYKKNTL